MSAGKEITAKLGDTLGAIAAREGVPLDVVWGHEKNRAVKDRGHPDLVYPGDVIFVPLPEEKWTQGQVGGEIAAKLNVPAVSLKLRIHVNGVPTEGVACVASFAPKEEKKTEKGGKLELELPGWTRTFTMFVKLPAPKKKSGEKTVPPPLLRAERDLTFLVGHFENDAAVLQARLTNLGFHCGKIDGQVGKRTRGALRRFQKRVGLDRNGDPGHRPTQDKLKQLHQDGWDPIEPLTDEDKLGASANPAHHVLTGDAWNVIDVLDGPEIIVDAHMHVNSGKCSPMPLVWDKLPGKKHLSRGDVRKFVIPALTLAHLALTELRATAKLGRKVDETLVSLTEAELVALTTAVTRVVIATGYVATESAQITTAGAIKGAAGLVDATGKILEVGADLDRGVASALADMERRLRAMVPDEAQQSAEVMKNATTVASRMLGAVVRLYRKGAERARRTANGVTEAMANVAGAASRSFAAGAAGEDDLARIQRATAQDLRKLANDTNRSFDLVQADAKRFVDFAAREVRGRIHQGGDGARAAVDTYHSRLIENYTEFLGNMAGFTAMGEKSTQEIGDLAAKGNDEVVSRLAAPAGGRLSMMMVMPMDMDFGHIDGYAGKLIYQPVEKRRTLDVTVRTVGGFGTQQRMERRPLPPDSTERLGPRPPERTFVPGEMGAPPLEIVVERNVVEEPGPFYRYSEYFEVQEEARPPRLDKKSHWLPEDEFELFQKYEKQVRDTLEVAAWHPWKLLPLYHYDPRRWNADPGTQRRTWRVGGREFQSYPQPWNTPLERYFGALDRRKFVGIKQYTALGYRPLDPLLLRQEDFYSRCADEGDPIPIVCHCSPGGQYSLERPLYVLYESKVTGVPVSKLKSDTERLMEARGHGTREWEEYWFCEHYVSPFAWKKVLQKYPKLRLDLAHFGGDTAAAYTHWASLAPPRMDQGLLRRGWDGPMTWDDAIVKLCKEYENFYVDISFFLLDGLRAKRFEEMLATFPHMLDKILFGTDWWMTENAGLAYPKYVSDAKAALDRIDPELWQRFSWVNPARFYRLKENAEALADALRAAAPTDPKLNEKHNASVERGLELLMALSPGAANAR